MTPAQLRAVAWLGALAGVLLACPALAHDGDAEAELSAAVDAGEISQLRAQHLRVLAQRAPERLPDRWLQLADSPPCCLTPALRDLQQHLADLPPDAQAEIAALLAPPPTDGPWLQSALYPLRVHYNNDSDRPTAVAALEILERSWRIEVDELGFHAPLPDGGFAGSDDLDVFIVPRSGGAASVGLEPNRATPWNDWSTYITLDPDAYGGDLLGVTLAHEFNHSCQAADDWFETIVALESTATFIEDRVYDDNNDYYNALSYFQALPHEPVDYLGGTWAWYVYAAALFPHFISERYGDDAIVQMWQASRQRGYRNEPDFLDGLDVALAPYGSSFEQAAREFMSWRYFMGSKDDGAHFSEGAAVGDTNQVLLEGKYTTRTLPRGPALLNHPPAETAGNLFEITVAPGDEAKALSWSFSGDTRARWAVDALIIPEGGPAVERATTLQTAVGSGSIPLAGAQRVVVVVVNLGDGAHDPEDREWSGLSYDLSVDLTNAP